jgi:hypothetical protein
MWYDRPEAHDLLWGLLPGRSFESGSQLSAKGRSIARTSYYSYSYSCHYCLEHFEKSWQVLQGTQPCLCHAMGHACIAQLCSAQRTCPPLTCFISTDNLNSYSSASCISFWEWSQQSKVSALPFYLIANITSFSSCLNTTWPRRQRAPACRMALLTYILTHFLQTCRESDLLHQRF